MTWALRFSDIPPPFQNWIKPSPTVRLNTIAKRENGTEFW
jgi:hypothetical protein